MDTAKTMKDTPELHERLSVERVRIHFTQLPAIIIVPSLGGLFSAWVLWGAIENRLLVIGLCIILLVSVLRVLLYRWYFSSVNAILKCPLFSQAEMSPFLGRSLWLILW